MRKLIILFVLLFVLVGCSDENTEQVKGLKEAKSTADEKKQSVGIDENEKVEAEEKNDKQLPINLNAFAESYNKYTKKFDDIEEIVVEDHEIITETLSINQNVMNMVFGDLIEANVFLNALGDNVEESEKEKILSINGDMTTGVSEEGYFVDELELSSVNLSITALDASSITINVTAR